MQEYLGKVLQSVGVEPKSTLEQTNSSHRHKIKRTMKANSEALIKMIKLNIPEILELGKLRKMRKIF